MPDWGRWLPRVLWPATGPEGYVTLLITLISTWMPSAIVLNAATRLATSRTGHEPTQAITPLRNLDCTGIVNYSAAMGVVDVQDAVVGIYAMAFRDRYRGSYGAAFQDLFSAVMEQVHPDGDFVRVRPWGNIGDQKNDGYIYSTRQLFAVYGPRRPTAADVCNKVTSDYEGAVPYWEEWFSEFIFVHNDPEGVGPQVVKTILKLNARVDELKVNQREWSRSRRGYFRCRLSA